MSEEEITISLSEEITCPHGEGHRFLLRDGLAESTIRRIRTLQAEQSARQTAALRARLESEFREQQRLNELRLEELGHELAEWRQREFKFLADVASFEKEKSEAAHRLAKQLALEREQIRAAAKTEEEARFRLREQTWKDQSEAQNRLIREIRTELSQKNVSELGLRQELDQARTERELAIAQAVTAAQEVARKDATLQVRAALQAEYEQRVQALQLRQAELERQRDAAREAAEQLQKRMAQGSQEAQGESLEAMLEKELALRFGADQVEPIAKGVHGADIVQTVYSGEGRRCGSITWETKYAQNWNSKWVEKLRKDLLANKSEFGVLVTTALPAEIKYFGQVDGIWVCSFQVWLPLAMALRQQLIGLAFARASAEGREQKMDVLYRYLTGAEFRERVNATLQTFITMRTQLEKERRAIMKHWSAREKQIQAVLEGVSGMYGDLQGIIGEAALPEIPTLSLEFTEPGEE
jgi:hypothetical protein